MGRAMVGIVTLTAGVLLSVMAVKNTSGPAAKAAGLKK